MFVPGAAMDQQDVCRPFQHAIVRVDVIVRVFVERIFEERVFDVRMFDPSRVTTCCNRVTFSWHLMHNVSKFSSWCAHDIPVRFPPRRGIRWWTCRNSRSSLPHDWQVYLSRRNRRLHAYFQ